MSTYTLQTALNANSYGAVANLIRMKAATPMDVLKLGTELNKHNIVKRLSKDYNVGDLYKYDTECLEVTEWLDLAVYSNNVVFVVELIESELVYGADAVELAKKYNQTDIIKYLFSNKLVNKKQ